MADVYSSSSSRRSSSTALCVALVFSTGLAVATPRVVPRHVAIIPDGNGRWAVSRGLPRAAGHAAGADVAWKSARTLFERGVEVVSIFALSTENMPPAREASEVSSILRLTVQLLRSHRDALADGDIAVQVVHAAGCEAQLPNELRAAVHALRTRAADRRSESPRAPRVLNLAVAYGGRADIADAARALARKAAAGTLVGGADAIDEQMVAAHLSTGADAPSRISSLPASAVLPDVDLVIRTSGERRLSNFLLWQCAYAELHFCAALWPDVGEVELDAALEQFAHTDRRFGRAKAVGVRS